MNWPWIVLGLAAVLVLAEAYLLVLVRYFRPRFQWLITPADAVPQIDPELVEKHRQAGFDPELGWVRKPETGGTDQTVDGPKSFWIDKLGYRANPGFEEMPQKVAVFGDSFAFCRLVNDDETWPHYLSKRFAINVSNFGVGNYGIDQALLRLEKEMPELEAPIILMAVVPETMARVHSYWKHYFEYGNVLAFKPRFRIENGKLRHYLPAVQDPDQYRTYWRDIKCIQELDPFYRSKFLRDTLAFPIVGHLVSGTPRHIAVLWHLSWGALRQDPERGRRRAFESVLRDNARHTAKLYANPRGRELLSAVVQRFNELCRDHGRQSLLMIIPQPTDLERQARGKDDYQDFFLSLKSHLPVLDLTNLFLAHEDWTNLFVGGRLGPHLNSQGNKLVADAVAPILSSLMEFSSTSCQMSHHNQLRSKDRA